MSLQKQIQIHELGLAYCRAALESEAKYGEATNIVVNVCKDLARAGVSEQDVFHAVTQELGHKDCSHPALIKARMAVGLPALVIAA